MWYLLLMLSSVFAKKNLFTLQKTLNQGNYVNFMKTQDLVVCLGPAGTGKTMFACLEAIQQLKDRDVDKIVITRPIVSVEDEQLGFLPGNINQKMDPWTRPIFDIFTEYYSISELNLMIKNKVIEISPLAFMRGRTFKNAFIIADEMQNSTPNQMLMLTTRIGDNTKMVVTGDLKQSDRSAQNGLSDFIAKFKAYPKKTSIALVELTGEDIKRSKTVKTILEIYENKVCPLRKEINADAALMPKSDLPRSPIL
uniref:PhoH-like protein n=1 Tax=viral metagenome TaxID=1070528 RepID=A0A6C0HT33_9ZZZZ